jgi:peptidoglycan/LPS O-acetylase OafA/YrhL
MTPGGDAMPVPSDSSTAPRRFPYMDSMRAAAALAVLTFHTLLAADLPQPISGWVRSGNQGVAVFFLISGLLLYHPFAVAHLRDGEAPWVPGYAWRRFLRIVPVYWVALVAVAFFTSKPEPFPGGALRYFGFAQVYEQGTLTRGISQAWTLDVEVLFYILIPVFAAGVRATRRKTQAGRLRVELAALALLAAACWAYRLWVYGRFGIHDHASYPYRFVLPYFLDVFAIGMALAVGTAWWSEHPRRDPGKLVDRAPWVPWAVSVGALTVIGMTWGGAVAAQSWSGDASMHLLVIVVALGAILPACVGDQGTGWVRRRVLADPRLLYVGLVSYSLYLWHGGIASRLLPRIGDHLSGYAEAVVAEVAVIAVSLAVSAVSYRLIERPALSLGRLVPRHRKRIDRAAAELDEHAAP